MLSDQKKTAIIAIVEKGRDGGYSVFAKEIPGAYGYGLTEEEAKQDFVENVSEQLEHIRDKTGQSFHYDVQNIEYCHDFL